MDTEVSINFTWQGTILIASLRKAAKDAVKQAITIYYWEIWNLLHAHWGSVQYRGNARKTVAHSPEGMPPYVQTENLANSINVAYDAKANKISGAQFTALDDQSVGAVYTDVEYARVLEYGGIGAEYKASRLKYTSWILINPIRHSMYIAARPAWRPAYYLTRSRMIAVIRSTLRKGITFKM